MKYIKPHDRLTVYGVMACLSPGNLQPSFHCHLVYFFLAEKSGQRPGVGTPGNALWGCAAQFSKSGIE